jgi:hypothetical protein
MKWMIAITLVALAGCNAGEKKEATSMAGAYKMLSQSVKTDKTDSTYKSLEQLKIYTDDHMMYANVNPSDSASAFGVATYTLNNDTVTENSIYGGGGSSASDSAASFKLIIQKTAKGYTQVIPEMETGGQKIKLTEEYDSVGTGAKTALDGTWKASKIYYITGKDTSWDHRTTQFKTYYAGHFIFGHTYKDSTNKLHTGIGFGAFTMTGNKVKESGIASTYSAVRGHDFDIDVEMNGNDAFKQTIIEKSGNKQVEEYQRLKK